MSNFYEDASVVMVPSGYKTSKVYSSVPDDGSADLTFSRSNDTATRVGPDGLIEKVRTNELTYSNDFSNAAWTKAGVTITSGQADPNGGTSAFKIDFASGGNYYIGQFYLGAGSKTNSIWLRADSAVQIGLSNGTDLITGPTLTTSWVRYQAPQTSASSSGGIQIDNYFGVTTPQLAITIYAYQAQLETGDIATDYIETTTSAVSVGPLANIPRLDYSGGANSPSLLLEPQRTNLVTYSEQFDSAAWTKAASGTGSVPVVTANTTISPDGYQNADTIVFDSGAGTTSSDQSFINRAFGGQPAGTYTLSFYAKTNSGTAKILARHAGGYLYTSINLTDQWQRFEVTETFGTAGTISLDLGLRRGLANEPLISSVTCQIWGCQLEAASYATSYIPTLSAAVTRGADVASKTGISSLIGQTEGTIFVDFYHDISVTAALDTRIHLSSGTTANWIFVGFPDGGSKLLRFYVNDGSGALSFFSSSGIVQGRNKIAFAYKSGDFVGYLNGAQVATNSTVRSIPTCSQIDLQGGAPNASAQERANYNQALLFTTRLSNADLETLTTL